MLDDTRWDHLAPAGAPRGAAVVCHPHPDFGGDRHNPVVDALYRALPTVGVAALRFDVSSSDHEVALRETADGINELEDLHGPVAMVAAGYSFGAGLAASVAHPGLVARVLVAPSFHAVPEGGVVAGTDGLPVLVLVPAHDQLSPPDAVRAATAGWQRLTVEEVPMADHFLAGRTAHVADRVTAWLDAVL